MAHSPSIVPYFSHADPHAAIDSLERAFGMERVQVLDGDGDDGTLTHAELRHRDGVMMIGTGEAPHGSPGVYLVVEDLDADHANAAEAGATIVDPPEDTEFGTRRYRARDAEGHEWSFGSYAPSTEPPDWG